MINPQELIFCVDEHNNPIDPMPRDIAHEQGVWHRTVHIYVFNKEGELLVQLRSPYMTSNANKWDSRFGGHVLAGKSYDETAKDELTEELGLTGQELVPVFTSTHENGTNREFSQSYILKFKDVIPAMHFADNEVVETRWMTLQQVKQAMLDNPDKWTSNAKRFEAVCEKLIQAL